EREAVDITDVAVVAGKRRRLPQQGLQPELRSRWRKQTAREGVRNRARRRLAGIERGHVGRALAEAKAVAERNLRNIGEAETAARCNRRCPMRPRPAAWKRRRCRLPNRPSDSWRA